MEDLSNIPEIKKKPTTRDHYRRVKNMTHAELDDYLYRLWSNAFRAGVNSATIYLGARVKQNKEAVIDQLAAVQTDLNTEELIND